MRHPLVSALMQRFTPTVAAVVLLGSLGGTLSACDVYQSGGNGGINIPTTPEVVDPPADPTPALGTFYFALDGVSLNKTERENLTSYNGEMRLEFRGYVGQDLMRFRIYVPANAQAGKVYPLSPNGDFRVRFVRIFPDQTLTNFEFVAGAIRVDKKTDTALAGTFRCITRDTGRPGSPRTETVGVFNLEGRIVQSTYSGE
ncbi:MAG: hypothetical protein LCH53_01590 [Bacteroidetes bacterium]|nr:hypothetical protein [Bacteroidota bacterium]